ncbi:MAG: S41 family peptidase [Blastocatellia bacterium]
MMKKLALVWLFALSLATGGMAQIPTPVVVGAPPSGEKPEDLRRKTFDIVWQTVKDKHFDPRLGGVNWDRVRGQYEPRAAAATSDPELYRVLQEMLGELHQSHFNIIPPEAIIPEEEKQPGGGIGIELRMIDGAAVITRVEPDSPAFRAGLRTGFVIKKAGGKSVEQFAGQVARSNQSEAMNAVRITRRILGEVNGEPGTTTLLTVLDGRNTPREAAVGRERLKGELSPPLGNFPPQYTEFESKRLGGNIGYIRFNIFTTPVIGMVRQAIRDLRDTDGLVFDLRGNPGGVGGIAVSIGGQLVAKGGSFGTMKMRTSEVKFAVFPQQDAYAGPVAILMDGMSASTSEIFAAGMQELGRAIVVGERSAGACLPSYFQKLPTGAIFQFAVADFKTPKGILVEGRGVTPDLEVKWNRASLLAGRDAQLDAAIERLQRLRRKSRAI